MKKVIAYHILFWLLIFGMIVDSMLYDYDWGDAILFSLVECGINAFVAYVNLLLLIPKFYEKKNNSTYLISVVVLFLIMLIPYYLTDLGYYLLDPLPLRIVISYTINFISLILFSFLFWRINQYEFEKERRLAISNEKLKTELLLLKSQVSPHFLFNTLNNIYSLSIAKHEHAPVMIEKLSEILRYLIYEGKKDKVILEKEANLIKEYVDLQLLKQIKGGKQTELSVDGVEPHHKIAPLILVNLVENCFKHGDVNHNPNGFLRIVLNVEDNTLFFKTENSYQQNEEDIGIGISNISEQLKHIYPEQHQISINKENATFIVSLTINLN